MVARHRSLRGEGVQFIDDGPVMVAVPHNSPIQPSCCRLHGIACRLTIKTGRWEPPNKSVRVSQLQFVAALFTIFFMTMLAASGVALSQGTTTTPAQLSEPKVIMEADPLPPFTYWVPENSTIRNHPRLSSVWIAETADGLRVYYFGDRCRASEFQGFIGKRLDAFPERPADATWRMACSICAVTSDLGRERMNVFYDDVSRKITSISCG
ncbi:hypothetical protein ATER59S_03574 [Aquamicrobium terrae]